MFRKPKRKLYALIFVLPTFLAFCIGFIYPFIDGIRLSFYDFKIITKIKGFVGFRNYARAFEDAAIAFDSYVSDRWGLSNGRVSLITK